MSKKTVGKTAAPKEESAVAVVEENAVVTNNHFEQSGDMQGQWGDKDLQVPYLSLVGKSGKLSDSFTPGSFVYDKQVVLSDGKESPLYMTVLSATKYFVEDIPYDPEIMPKRFERIEDAIAEGYSDDYYEAEKRVKPAASLVCMVPMKEEDGASYFPPENVVEAMTKHIRKVAKTTEPLEEKFSAWGKAMWIVQSSAFNRVGKAVATAKFTGHLRDGLHKGPWITTSKLESRKSNSWYVPIAQKGALWPEEVAEWIESEVL